MKNIWIITCIVIAIVVVAIIALVLVTQNPGMMNNQKVNNPPATNNPVQTSPVTNNQTISNNPTGYTVIISNFAFSPSTLTIKKGDSVVWTNQDSVAHTVTSNSGTELSSSALSTGQTYGHTFNTPGTYNYHCSIHTSMRATIIVQ